jgi:hypothetical protein
LELGTILAVASNGYADVLPAQSTGEVLRLAGADDEHQAASVAQGLGDAFSFARHLAAQLELPIEIIDTEHVTEPRTVVIHYLGLGEFDPRPLVSALAAQFDVYVELLDLTPPSAKAAAPESGGEEVCAECGRVGGGCGSADGCGSCGSGGGCGAGCSAASAKSFQADWQAYFADLRGKMEKRFPIAMV